LEQQKELEERPSLRDEKVRGIADEARQAANEQDAAAAAAAVPEPITVQQPQESSDQQEQLLRQKLKKVERLLIDLVADPQRKDSKEYEKLMEKRQEYTAALKAYSNNDQEGNISLSQDVSTVATSQSTMGVESQENQQTIKTTTRRKTSQNKERTSMQICCEKS
jgi:hypothetical protein